MPAQEFAALLTSGVAADDLASEGPMAVVLEGALPPDEFTVPPLLPLVVVVASDDADHPAVGSCDLAATGDDLDHVIETVERAPHASTSLAVLLRASESRTVADGLLAESAVYGVLQAGSEFARWRVTGRTATDVRAGAESVRSERTDDVVRIVLSRPEVHNALDAGLRDALAEALQLAISDPSVRIELSGDGPSFCSGGHVDEFGTRSDVASAHWIRLARSLGWMLHQLGPRTHAIVHGSCRGSGVELPAFVGRVTADPGTTFGLPELGMGLIPGAGGTISLPRRMGRRRTAWLALTGKAIDAETARRWGLVDDVAPVSGKDPR